MKYHGVSVRDDSGDFVFYLPRLYSSNQWKYGTYYIYDGTNWKMVGGACTQMIPFVESGDGQVEYNDDVLYQVRQSYEASNDLRDSGGNYLTDVYSARLHAR